MRNNPRLEPTALLQLFVVCLRNSFPEGDKVLGKQKSKLFEQLCVWLQMLFPKFKPEIPGQILVCNDNADLAVQIKAARVRVGRTDGQPLIIDNHDFAMNEDAPFVARFAGSLSQQKDADTVEIV